MVEKFAVLRTGPVLPIVGILSNAASSGARLAFAARESSFGLLSFVSL